MVPYDTHCDFAFVAFRPGLVTCSVRSLQEYLTVAQNHFSVSLYEKLSICHKVK